MTIIMRFQRLSFWDKTAVLGSIASIISLAIYFLPATNFNRPEKSFQLAGNNSMQIGNVAGNVVINSPLPAGENQTPLKPDIRTDSQQYQRQTKSTDAMMPLHGHITLTDGSVEYFIDIKAGKNSNPKSLSIFDPSNHGIINKSIDMYTINKIVFGKSKIDSKANYITLNITHADEKKELLYAGLYDTLTYFLDEDSSGRTVHLNEISTMTFE